MIGTVLAFRNGKIVRLFLADRPTFEAVKRRLEADGDYRVIRAQ